MKKDCPEICPAKLWCLLSGGKDSVTTAHVLASQDRLAGCVFIDTGISTPDIQPFVRDLCQDQGWPLKVYRTPVEYEDMVMKFGFPAQAQHNMTMFLLKGRALRLFHKNDKNAVAAS